MNAIVRELLEHHTEVELTASFYADDGRLASVKSHVLQRACEQVTDLFTHVGMKVNPARQRQWFSNGNLRLQLSSLAFK